MSFEAESLALTRKRLAKATTERERLIQAYLAQAIELPQFQKEQARIGREIDDAEELIRRAAADDSPYQQVLRASLDELRRANERYGEADDYDRRLLNRQVLEKVEITDGQVTSVELKDPFHGLFLLAASNKCSLVGGPGFEPGASRSRNLSGLVYRRVSTFLNGIGSVDLAYWAVWSHFSGSDNCTNYC